MKPKSSRPEPKGPSQRQLRVGEEIRHALAEILLRTEFHDPALARAHLTISEVRMSPDLKHALVFITQLGNQDVRPLLPALTRVSPFLRAQLAPKLGLRVTPDLKFCRRRGAGRGDQDQPAAASAGSGAGPRAGGGRQDAGPLEVQADHVEARKASTYFEKRSFLLRWSHAGFSTTIPVTQKFLRRFFKKSGCLPFVARSVA